MTVFDWFHAATALVAVMSFAANFTKTDSDNKVVAAISQVVHVFALNLGGEAAPK